MPRRGKHNEKLAKRFARRIKDYQIEDRSLPEPWLFVIRYQIPWIAWKCIGSGGIRVEADALEAWTGDVPRDQIPRFFRSQLEAQKLMSEQLPRIPISPLLKFVLSIVPQNPRNCFPLLIRCFSTRRNKTLQLFLFSAVRIMARQEPYTVKELLEIRDEEAPTKLRTILDNDPDLGALIPKDGKPGNSQAHRDVSAQEPPRLKKTSKSAKSDASSSSDEVLFKGRAAHRQQMKQKQELQRLRKSASDSIKACTSQALLPIKTASEQSSQADAVPTAVRGDSGEHISGESREIWNYRGRTEEEQDIRTPIPPPTDTLAQKSEGFKRFFRAVKSPDHVRVTAGGRIVPNLRVAADPSSPSSSKRANDSYSAQDSSRALGVMKSDQANTAVDQSGQYPSLSPALPPPCFPAYSGVIATPHGHPPPPGYIYRPVHPINYPAPAPPPNHQFVYMVPVSAASASQGTQNAKSSSEQGGAQAGPKDKTDNVLLSPPEHFDSSRPIFYNGQVMYPASAGMPPPSPGFIPPSPGLIPYSPMLGMFPGGHPHFASHMMMPPPPPGAFFPVLTPSTYAVPPTGAPGPQGFMPAPMVPVGPVPRPKGPAPSASSIKMSAITQSHINSFRNRLKYLEDQLQFNRHQIDENQFKEDIKKTKDNIANFEAQVKQHLEEEAALEGLKASKPTTGPGTAESKHVAIQEDRFPEAHFEDGGNLSGSIRFKCSKEKLTYDWRKPSSTLPSEAALAPPFKPRATHESGAAETQLQAAQVEDAPALLLTPPSHSLHRHGSQENIERTTEWLANSGTKVHPSSPYFLKEMTKVTAQSGKQDGQRSTEARNTATLFPKASRVAPNQEMPSSTPSFSNQPAPFKDASTLRKSKSDQDPFRPTKDVEQCHMARYTQSEEEGSSSFSESFMPSQLSVVEEDTDQNVESDAMTGSARHQMEKPLRSKDSGSMKVLKSRENSAKAAGSSDRRPEKTSGAKLWENLVKKPATTSSGLSSTTAQGVLPQFAGHAAASLSPTMTRVPVSTIRGVSFDKSTDLEATDGKAARVSSLVKPDENRPLHRAT